MWVDLGSGDARAAVGFYGALFGWDCENQGEEAGNYHLARLRGLNVAGLGGQPEPGPSWWTTYFSTADVEATIARVEAAGGQLVAGPLDVMGQGRMAVFMDPTGAAFSVWQPQAHTGSGIVGEPGTMWWHELNTREPTRALDFYRSVFGWTSEHFGEGGMDYTVLRLGNEDVGGLMTMGDDYPAEVPNNWLVYFAVEDCDAAVAKVRQLGGSVRMEAIDIPVCRFAVVADPDGAVFAVAKPADHPAG
jgi:hypothetical protein